MSKKTGILLIICSLIIFHSSYSQTRRPADSCEVANTLNAGLSLKKGVNIDDVKDMTRYTPLQIGKWYHWEQSGNSFDYVIYTNGAYEYYGPIPPLLNTAIQAKALSYLKAQQVLGIPLSKGFVYQLSFRDDSYLRMNVDEEGQVIGFTNSVNCNTP